MSSNKQKQRKQSKEEVEGQVQENMSQSSYDSQQQQQENSGRSFESEEDISEQNSSEDRRKKQQLLELEQKRIKAELKEIPFGQLLRYKNLKEQIVKTTTKQIKKDRSKKQQPGEKKDKNAPRQIKIMRRPPKNKMKQIFTSQRPKSIDPRFENYAGSYNQDLATKTYSFIEEMRNNEVNYIKKQLKNKKLKEESRSVLLRNYNEITSLMKKLQHEKIQRKVRSELRGKGVQRRSVVREEVEKAKLEGMEGRQQERRLKKKEKKIQKQKWIEKKTFMKSRK